MIVIHKTPSFAPIRAKVSRAIFRAYEIGWPLTGSVEAAGGGSAGGTTTPAPSSVIAHPWVGHRVENVPQQGADQTDDSNDQYHREHDFAILISRPLDAKPAHSRDAEDAFNHHGAGQQ